MNNASPGDKDRNYMNNASPGDKNRNYINNTLNTIFSRQASLTRQAFLITPLRYKTGKNAYANQSAKWHCGRHTL